MSEWTIYVLQEWCSVHNPHYVIDSVSGEEVSQITPSLCKFVRYCYVLSVILTPTTTRVVKASWTHLEGGTVPFSPLRRTFSTQLESRPYDLVTHPPTWPSFQGFRPTSSLSGPPRSSQGPNGGWMTELKSPHLKSLDRGFFIFVRTTQKLGGLNHFTYWTLKPLSRVPSFPIYFFGCPPTSYGIPFPSHSSPIPCPSVSSERSVPLFLGRCTRQTSSSPGKSCQWVVPTVECPGDRLSPSLLVNRWTISGVSTDTKYNPFPRPYGRDTSSFLFRVWRGHWDVPETRGLSKRDQVEGYETKFFGGTQ